MNTTRIVVLPLAVGAGGVACRARLPDNKSLPTEPVARLPGETANAVRDGVSSLAPRP